MSNYQLQSILLSMSKNSLLPCIPACEGFLKDGTVTSAQTVRMGG